MVAFSSLYTTRLDRELGTDDSTVLFTTARRKAAINEGVQEFATLTGALTRWAAIAVVNGQAEYDLNSTAYIAAGDFGGFAKEPVEYIYTDTAGNQSIFSGPTLPRRDVPWLDQYRSSWPLSTQASSIVQHPQLHYVRIDGAEYNLGFSPYPSAGAGTAVIGVPYIADAPVLTSDTEQPYTFSSAVRQDLTPYHQGAVHYAAHQLEKLRRDDQASDRQLQKFLGYVQRCLQDMKARGPKAVRQARNYFSRRGAGNLSGQA